MLARIAETIKNNVPDTVKVVVDLGSDYKFPVHIASTELRPDLVWWDDSKKFIVLLELTIPFDTLMHEAAI